MKKSVLALVIAATLAPVLAQAEAGDWVVRMRATHINPSESSSLGRTTNRAFPGTATLVSPGAELEVESNTIPTLDISYYITKNIAAELILALGSKHDVNIHKNAGTLGRQELGEVNVLPPTLTLQWHFNPDQMIDPYVGAGINYTRFMDNGLSLARTHAIRVDRDSFGGALQAGVDINLKDGWLINADVKKLWIDTDVRMNLGGAGYRRIDSLDIDPLVVSFGIGKKF